MIYLTEIENGARVVKGGLPEYHAEPASFTAIPTPREDENDPFEPAALLS
jgi:hypothetical protein